MAKQLLSERPPPPGAMPAAVLPKPPAALAPTPLPTARVERLVDPKPITEEVRQTWTKSPKNRYRVTLTGCKVRVVDPVKEWGVFQDYLDVDAETPKEAIEKFADYNGIPMRTNELTGARQLASEHTPKVELLTK